MTLHEILGVLRARWLLVVLGVLAGVVVAAALAWSTTPVYAAKAQLFVSTGSGGDPGATYEGGLFSQQRVLSYARIVSSPELLESVIGALGLDTTAAELAENLRAEVPVDTVLIDIEVEDTSPRQAQAIANEIVARFPAFVALFISVILFGLGLLALHWREKDEQALEAEAKAAASGPVAVTESDESELTKV